MSWNLSTRTQLFLGLIFIELCFIFLLAISLHEYIYPTLFAIILVYVSIPAIHFLQERLGLPRAVSVGCIFLLQLVIIAVIFIYGLPFVVKEVSSVLKTLPFNVSKLMQSFNQFAMEHGIALDLENSAFEQKVSTFFKNLANLDINALKRTMAIAQGTANQLIGTLSWIINLLLIPILYFFLGIHYDAIFDCIERYTPSSYRMQVSMLLQELNNILSSFLRGELLLISSLAVCYTIGFNIVGVPFATGLGILTGVLSFIPFIGSLTGMVIATFSLYAVQASMYTFISLGVVYMITGTLESLILIPYFIGNSLGMSTFTSLIVLIVATKELGGIGLILGIPLAAIMKHLFLSYAFVCRRHEVI